MKKIILSLILFGVLMGFVNNANAQATAQVLLKNIDVIASADNARIELKFDGPPKEFVKSYHEEFLQIEFPDTSVNPPKQWINVKDELFRNIFVYQFDDKTVRARLYTNANVTGLQDKIKFSNETNSIVLIYKVAGDASVLSGTNPAKGHVDEGHSENIPLASVLKGGTNEKQLLPKVSGSPEIYGSFFKMIVVLGLLISLLLIVLYVVKKYLWKKVAKGQKDESIRVLTSAYIGPKKSIALIEVAGERIVVGITADNISMLTKVSKDMDFNEVLNEQVSSITDETLKSIKETNENANLPPFQEDIHLSPPLEKGGKGGFDKGGFDAVNSDTTTGKKADINDELWEKA